MKGFSITAVLVVFAAAVLPALAAPLPSTDNFEVSSWEHETYRRYDLMFLQRDEYITLEDRAVSKCVNFPLLFRQLTVDHRTAKSAITWLQTDANHATINVKPVCFYSGYTMVTNTKLKPPVDIKVSAHGKLNGFMADHGCNSIDNVMAMAGQSANSKKWTGEDWLEVSRALANAVSGTVRVLLGTTVPADSVWIKAEKPALKANSHVTAIEHWEIEKSGKITKKANIK